MRDDSSRRLPFRRFRGMWIRATTDRPKKGASFSRGFLNLSQEFTSMSFHTIPQSAIGQTKTQHPSLIIPYTTTAHVRISASFSSATPYNRAAGHRSAPCVRHRPDRLGSACPNVAAQPDRRTSWMEVRTTYGRPGTRDCEIFLPLLPRSAAGGSTHRRARHRIILYYLGTYPPGT